MAFFILPPPQFVADNKEIPKQIVKQAEDYQNLLLKELKITDKVFKIDKGDYVGTQVFNWDQKYTAILLTTIYFQKGKSFKNEWIKTASLIRQEDCLHIGSIWSFNDAKIIPFPIQNSNESISQIAVRTFNSSSPIKISLNSNFSDRHIHDFFDVVLQEEFSKNKITTITNEGRFFCKIETRKELKFVQKEGYPAKPHRIVEVKMLEQSLLKPPMQVNYNLYLTSSISGQKDRDLYDKKQASEIFDPVKIADDFVQKINPLLNDLTGEEFKIIKRVGSWVYLNRGRAFGLTIGTRLIGQNNSKLHIIRYEFHLPEEIDSSIAFIRHEDKEHPLKEGDILKIDKMIYSD